MGRREGQTHPRTPRELEAGRTEEPEMVELEDGSRPEQATRVAALSCSLIESAKLAGVEPRAHPREATRRAVRNPGTATLARDLKSSES